MACLNWNLVKEWVMIVGTSHLQEVLAICADRDPVRFLLDDIVAPPNVDKAFQNRVMMMLSKQQDPKGLHMDAKLAKEISAQAWVIIWILGPVWAASGHRLPRVTGLEFKEALGNEPRIDWEDFFSQFVSFSPEWQACVDVNLRKLTMDSSRFAVGRICRFILSKLTPPMV